MPQAHWNLDPESDATHEKMQSDLRADISFEMIANQTSTRVQFKNLVVQARIETENRHKDICQLPELSPSILLLLVERYHQFGVMAHLRILPPASPASIPQQQNTEDTKSQTSTLPH